MIEIDTEEDISMNKTQLKNFAVAARVALIERVKDRARGFGIDEKTCAGGAVIPSKMVQTLGGALLSQTEINQRDALLARIQSRGYDQVMEETAYTWFNRFIALRYMQEHNLLPVSVRVLPDAPGALPELVRQAQNVELDGVDFSHVVELLEGNRTETLYTELLIALCNQLSDVLPQMFEPISDYTELLFPDGLLREDSVLAMLAEVDAENWADIQVIGWLYQYYNTELKNETFELLKKNVKITKERIGAATQLFTPEWIVRYMVENSLGRLWLEGHDDPALRRRWRYYMDEAEQEPQVAVQLAQIRAKESRIQPEEIRLLDPCMGSGHILVYAFDVLMEIYRTQGYTDRDAVSAIIENNLYGLDIDDRAAQLAYFALMMKACEHDRRFLRRGVQPHVCAVAEWNGNPNDSPAWSDGQRRAARMLRETFTDAKEYGSILSIPKPLADALDALGENPFGGETALGVDAENLQRLAAQAKIMARKYDVVVTNPPYMGSSGMGAKLAEFVKKQYPDSKSDLFAVFMERGREYTKANGYLAMITQHAWMFLSSFEKLRAKLMELDTVNMAHLGARAFEEIGGEVVQTTAFVMQNRHVHGFKGMYARLIEPTTQDGKEEMFLDGQNRFSARQDNFEKIPGAPVAYWVSEKIIKAYMDGNFFEKTGHPKVGMQTSNNDKFLRMWHEVNYSEFNGSSFGLKWIKYLKGGAYRKWYGNLEYLLFYNYSPNFIMQQKHARVLDTTVLEKEKCTWTDLTSGENSFRYAPNDTFHDISGHCFYPSKTDQFWLLAYANTKVFSLILKIFNSTMHCQVGDVARVVTPTLTENEKEKITNESKKSVGISKEDWDSFETSWDFKKHPLI
ncbi:MAG: BREX-1 system adenine-specific DNA-methyltransferase PglX [Christensenellales bacterium]|nr:BREX-1 system adenine-specific DNA-methyltransferase PglX [Christensenellales bacterium]